MIMQRAKIFDQAGQFGPAIHLMFWLSSQYLLALRDADCAEQPIGWLGIIPPDFDGSSPSEVMVEVFGRDAMEQTQPFLKAAVIAVDVVDVEVGCLRPRPTGGR